MTRGIPPLVRSRAACGPPIRPAPPVPGGTRALQVGQGFLDQRGSQRRSAPRRLDLGSPYRRRLAGQGLRQQRAGDPARSLPRHPQPRQVDLAALCLVQHLDDQPVPQHRRYPAVQDLKRRPRASDGHRITRGPKPAMALEPHVRSGSSDEKQPLPESRNPSIIKPKCEKVTRCGSRLRPDRTL